MTCRAVLCLANQALCGALRIVPSTLWLVSCGQFDPNFQFLYIYAYAALFGGLLTGLIAAMRNLHIQAPTKRRKVRVVTLLL
jgi:hypothetical protein